MEKELLISRHAIIIMTRYPDPGQVKTRLIPALGEEGACRLHQKMVEHTMVTARNFSLVSPSELFVFFNGGSEVLMKSWLGSDAEYLPQSDGDLGAKMSVAFHEVFNRGCKTVMMIGTDCPDIDYHILSKSFSLLDKTEMVIGPAADGGYYLLGLKKNHDNLFKGIVWGSDQVFSQTMDAARNAQIRVSCLPELADIDRPEDLEQLRDMSGFFAASQCS
jgi:rSAM/selenodomain-associated transferase 1